MLRTLLFLDVAIKCLDMVSAMLAGFCLSRDVEVGCMQWFWDLVDSPTLHVFKNFPMNLVAGEALPESEHPRSKEA
jgi:hypothetical protein